MLKKFLAGLSVLALSLGMIALVAGPASAHTGTLSVSAVCQSDGTYLVTYSGSTSKVPDGGLGHTATLTVVTIKPSDARPVGAPETVVGNTVYSWTEVVPGGTTYVQSTAFLEWGDKVNDKPVTAKPQAGMKLGGTCGDTPDSKKITFCHYHGSDENGGSGKYGRNTTGLPTFYNDGHIGHLNDIFPAGSVVINGDTHSWNAQGDQSLLQYPDCATPKDATASISIAAPGCDTNSVASVVGANFVPVTLDQTVGRHDVTIFAASGHTFADGTTSVVLRYVIVAGPVTQSTDPDAQCFVAPGPVACVATAGWQTEDLAPTLTPAGLSFDGPHAQAVDTYQRVTAGNMQGLTGMTYTVASASGYTARVVVEVNPNADLGSGVIHYATISTAAEAVDGVNAVQDGLWYTSMIAPSSPGGQGNPISWAAMTALMPTNVLLSAPSLHLQTNSTAGSHSIVTSISSSCGETDFVPVKPNAIRSTTVTTGDPVCSPTGGGTYDKVTHYWEQDSVWDAGTQSYSNPADSTPYEYQDATTEVFEVGTDVCPTHVMPAEPSITDQSCTVNQDGSGSFSSGAIVIAATTGVKYFVDGQAVASGPDDLAPGTYAVTAEAIPGYTLKGYPEGGWSKTIDSAKPCGTVTPAEPTVTDQTCSVDDSGKGSYTDGAITIPASTTVKYFIDGSPAAAGSHSMAPGTYAVTAEAVPNYTLTGYPELGWPETIKSALACGGLVSHPMVAPIVTFTQMSCTANGTYTLSNDLNAADGVIWTVDGSPVSEGTYQVTGNRTVHIHAAANGPDFGFADRQQQDWTLNFSVPTTCDLKTLALTGSAPVGGMVLGYFLLIAGLGLVALRMARRRNPQEPQE